MNEEFEKSIFLEVKEGGLILLKPVVVVNVKFNSLVVSSKKIEKLVDDCCYNLAVVVSKNTSSQKLDT